jgi:hypothetical protein
LFRIGYLSLLLKTPPSVIQRESAKMSQVVEILDREIKRRENDARKRSG